MAMCGNHPEAVAVAYCRECGKPLCMVCRNESLGAIYCPEHAPAANPFPAPGPPLFPPGPAGWATQQPAAAPPYAAPYGSPYGTSASYASSPYTSTASPYIGGFDAPPVSEVPPPGAVPPVAASPYAAPVQGTGSPAVALLLGAIPGVGAIYNGQYAKGLIHAVILGLLITIVSSNENGSLAPLVGILIGVWWFYMLIEAFHTARKRHQGIPVDEFSSLINLRSRAAFPVGAVVLIGLGAILLLDSSGLIPISRLLRFWPIGLILAGVYMLYARMERAPRATPTTSIPQEFIDERR